MRKSDSHSDSCISEDEKLDENEDSGLKTSKTETVDVSRPETLKATYDESSKHNSKERLLKV